MGKSYQAEAINWAAKWGIQRMYLCSSLGGHCCRQHAELARPKGWTLVWPLNSVQYLHFSFQLFNSTVSFTEAEKYNTVNKSQQMTEWELEIPIKILLSVNIPWHLVCLQLLLLLVKASVPQKMLLLSSLVILCRKTVKSTVVNEFKAFRAIGKVILRSCVGLIWCRASALTHWQRGLPLFPRGREGNRWGRRT